MGAGSSAVTPQSVPHWGALEALGRLYGATLTHRLAPQLAAELHLLCRLIAHAVRHQVRDHSLEQSRCVVKLINEI